MAAAEQEAADVEGWMGDWLGVPMFMSCYDPETVKRLVREAGFDLVETATQAQVEGNHEVSYLWVLAVRSPVEHGQL